MTFEEWKLSQYELGLLWDAKKKSKHPYGRYCPWMNKYLRVGQLSEHKNLLTVDEYLYKVFEANIGIDDIGVGMHNYQLCRNGDVGDYTVDNCSFKLREVNMRERTINGGSKRQADKIRGVKNPSKGFVHIGENNYRFKGYYVTPKGKFVTVSDAAKENSCGTMTVYDRCKKCDRVITKRATSTLQTLGADSLGKTYRELGWYFEEV